MARSTEMIGGDGTYSYAKNSTFQRKSLSSAMEEMAKTLTEALDLQPMLSGGSSSLFTITDLGCSVGPNTFFGIQAIVDAVTLKWQSQGLDPKTLEFQVFFNDQTTNDFNTLFANLPEDKNYLVAAVPGSFHDKLFPTSSINIAFSSTSLHWLSRTPKELEDEKSLAWNKGRIHYTDAPEAVVKAYAEQFEKDMDAFLRERAREVIPGGLVVAMMPGVPDGAHAHGAGICITFLGTILMDMVKEGLLDEYQVDSFNMPQVYPSVKEMTRLVERNGCFKIVRMELMRNVWVNTENIAEVNLAIRSLRAFAERSIESHMGREVVEQLFTRAFEQTDRLLDMAKSAGTDAGDQLFAILQRK